ncbi:MAG: hypothetical protein AAF399_24000 [Bacteroidota bacterium]
MNSSFKVLSLFLSLLFAVGMTSCKQDPIEPEEEPEETPMDFADITQIPTLTPNSPETVSGNIEGGEVMDDLSWAALSNVACFPGTRAIEFMGSQVYYQVEVPQGHEMFITVTPTGDRNRINLYGYLNFDGSNVPPLQSITTCEAGYELYVGNPDLTKPGEAQSISFAQAVNRDFTIFVAVSGAQDVLSGTFDLTFEIKPM